MKRIYPIIFALAFWGILIAPAIKPNVSIDTFEKDFGGHDKLIEGFNTLRFKLGDRVFPNILVGKDGWLFYTGDRSIESYQGTNLYSSNDLRNIRNNFDQLNDQLKQKGIVLVVVIAPNKSTIYPEYMPDQITTIGSKSRLGQFVDYMDQYGKTPVIDLRPDLIEASKTEQVYYKTDTHWNPMGQYIAYRKILSVLSQTYPVLVPHPLSDYEAVHAGPVTHDIPQILGTPNLKEDFWILQPKFETGTNFNSVTLTDGNLVRLSWNENQHLPSALIFHDSFMDSVLPFLDPHFRQITAIFRTAVPGVWSTHWVDQVHPDIVIIEYVERYMNYDFYIPGNQ